MFRGLGFRGLGFRGFGFRGAAGEQVSSFGFGYWRGCLVTGLLGDWNKSHYEGYGKGSTCGGLSSPIDCIISHIHIYIYILIYLPIMKNTHTYIYISVLCSIGLPFCWLASCTMPSDRCGQRGGRARQEPTRKPW